MEGELYTSKITGYIKANGQQIDSCSSTEESLTEKLTFYFEFPLLALFFQK